MRYLLDKRFVSGVASNLTPTLCRTWTKQYHESYSSTARAWIFKVILDNWGAEKAMTIAIDLFNKTIENLKEPLKDISSLRIV
jgi:hypothetical protein